MALPAPNPNDNTKAEAAAEKAAVKAGYDDESIAKKLEVSVDETEKAVDKATGKDGVAKLTDDGQIIGLDGKNPVSNENPDPRTIHGSYHH